MTPIVNDALGRVTKDKVLGLKDLEIRRMSGDLLNYSIVETSQNIKKSPGDLRRFAVTQTPVENHRLTGMKNSQRSKIITMKIIMILFGREKRRRKDVGKMKIIIVAVGRFCLYSQVTWLELFWQRTVEISSHSDDERSKRSVKEKATLVVLYIYVEMPNSFVGLYISSYYLMYYRGKI